MAEFIVSYDLASTYKLGNWKRVLSRFGDYQKIEAALKKLGVAEKIQRTVFLLDTDKFDTADDVYDAIVSKIIWAKDKLMVARVEDGDVVVNRPYSSKTIFFSSR